MSDGTPGPKVARPVVFQTQTLGRAVYLGELYDQRTGKFLGVQLYPKDKIKETETSIKHTELSLRPSTTFENKVGLLDINPQQSLEVLGGLVKVTGSASYLNDFKSNTNEYAFALALKMRLREKRFLFAELNQKVLRAAESDYINDGLATHFVSAIVYGANLIINFVSVKSELSGKERLEGRLEAQLNRLKGAINLQCSASAETKEEFKDMNDKFDLIVHCDVPVEQVPINPQDVLETFPQAAQLITSGGGIPISVVLQPIPEYPLTESPIHDIDNDLVDEVLKAFSMLDDLRSRFSVLQDSAKRFQDFVPELSRVSCDVAARFSKDHNKLLYQLCKFLYDYRRDGRPDPQSMFADVMDDGAIIVTEDKVLTEASRLHKHHSDLLVKDEGDQYPSSLAGLEAELSRFRYFVFDLKRAHETLRSPSRLSFTGEPTTPVYLSNVEDICRAIRLQTTITLFVMIPLSSKHSVSGRANPDAITPCHPEQLNPDLAVIRFLAILRRYAACLKDPSKPAYILYAENLEDLERRLPNHGEFSKLESPSMFIGKVSVQGELSWSGPMPTTERSLEIFHQPSGKTSGNDLDLVNGTQSFSVQIHARSPGSGSKPNREICVLQCFNNDTLFLRFRTPLKVEVERNRPSAADINSVEAPTPGQAFTTTFVQDIKERKWVLYLGDKQVNEVYFSNPDELLQDSTNLQFAYPASEQFKWWDGEVYSVRTFAHALSKEQVVVGVEGARMTKS